MPVGILGVGHLSVLIIRKRGNISERIGNVNGIAVCIVGKCCLASQCIRRAQKIILCIIGVGGAVA